MHTKANFTAVPKSGKNTFGALRALMLAGAVCSMPSLALAATIEAASKVDRVILYPDAALVTRLIEIDIPAGSHELMVGDLPATIDPASLRIEGSADAKFAIGSVDLRLSPAVTSKRKAEIEARLKTLKSERERTQDRIDAVEGRKAMIQRLAAPPEGKEAKPLDIENWAKAWEIIGKGLQAANEELRGLRTEETRLEEEITAIEAANAPGSGQPRRIAAIAMEAQSAGKASLTLSYRVRGASWRPIYDARLDTRSTKPGLELVRRAMIRQTSGEDWKDATLTLSTLRVARGTAAPAINAERIAFYERPPTPAPMPRAAAAPQVEAMAMATQNAADASRRKSLASAPREAIEEAQAAVEASAFQTEFTVPGKMALPSGNEEKSVRLSADKIEPKLAHKASPMLDPTAYLEAAFLNKSEVPILGGEVLLNRDGAFIGKGRFAEIAPGSEARLGFGADERVKIARVPLNREAKEPGFLGSSKSDEIRFRTDVRNLHAFPIDLTVLDRLPISEDQQITIERLPEMSKPDQENFEDKRGVFAWTTSLKPGEQRAFSTAYRIRWPANREIRPVPMQK